MSAFTMELDNSPGELARLCEAMASRGVNLVLCATTHGNSGAVAFIADDEAAAQAVLDGAGIEEFFAVICADDAAAAERALGDQVITR